MVELGIGIEITNYKSGSQWFNLDDKKEWDYAWNHLYKNRNNAQGFVSDIQSDYFTELEVSDTTELNDIFETYNLMDKLSETERDIARHIYDSGEWSGSLNDLLKLLSEREQ